ncbi:UDP-N-acetylmuramoyl-L-alanyl-D-glutamate--2,6-diaminopimelate ligase [Thermoflavimicrobium daqui]|uniref:UDP-N-acetylmuramoyl-L-alanyl-D-glutamate--2,6-diaminopimelate ligase n=1 Tax=Thermoflavimicrobium daqui TaxID=2137476 RepID=A0A364K726_9BACL|nr:UDP-N-acetylmuramoyl-L-alanyl-D-glutamate--2,6-diaminopimelate ligase [Thermoflavimicrobium daqui]RAL26012.1 UDP-N-acetylmuramoyl-L-alanyl-D-glutamate--2,6-diaminopimelate ligase [Thermoflavimicrobium daqui]
MRLEDIIQPLILKQVIGDLGTEIKGIKIDSRQVESGDLFIALRGLTVDGHRFIDKAISQGAAAVMVEEPISANIPVVIVPDTRRAMAMAAATFYRHPTKELKVIGVTGTNGKTTTTNLIQHILNDQDQKTGLIGTISMKVGNREYKVNNTTPEIVDLQRSFRWMLDEGCKYAAIEVSSHGLVMGRTRGCEFHIAVFTNLTQDHLDYHETMEKYRDAKGLLFNQLGTRYSDDPQFNQVAVLNADDPVSKHYANTTSAQVITYGIDQKADVRAENIRITATGTRFMLRSFGGDIEMNLQLVGKFNIYNALAAVSVALLEGISLEKVKKSLESISGVNGRFERVQAGQNFTVLVDYSHTPDSLENALQTIREFVDGRVICVVGCGGDRDRSKRPVMAQIAEKYSDLTIITSDNPRTEPPEEIIAEMVAGIKGVNLKRYETIVDRREAIHFAIHQAKANDVVLIAGKGHETYQEINGVRYDFDDRLVAKAAIESRRSEG